MKTLLVIVASAAAFGVVLALIGAIGKRTQRSRSFCRRCGQESHRHATRCTECGRSLVLESRLLARAMSNPFLATLLSPIRNGRRAMRVRMLVAGLLLFVASAATLGYVGWNTANGFDWYRIRTTASLLREVERAESSPISSAVKELTRRAQLNQLTRAELIAFSEAIAGNRFARDPSTSSTAASPAPNVGRLVGTFKSRESQTRDATKPIQTSSVELTAADWRGAYPEAEESRPQQSAKHLNAALLDNSTLIKPHGALETRTDFARTAPAFQAPEIATPTAIRVPQTTLLDSTRTASERQTELEPIAPAAPRPPHVAPEYRISNFSLVNGVAAELGGGANIAAPAVPNSLVSKSSVKQPARLISRASLNAEPLGPGWSPSGAPLSSPQTSRGNRIPGRRF